MLYYMYHKYLGRTPLYHAAEDGHTDVVKILLSQGANPDIQDDDGMYIEFILV